MSDVVDFRAEVITDVTTGARMIRAEAVINGQHVAISHLPPDMLGEGAAVEALLVEAAQRRMVTIRLETHR